MKKSTEEKVANVLTLLEKVASGQKPRAPELRSVLLKVAHENPRLRRKLLPLLVGHLYGDSEGSARAKMASGFLKAAYCQKKKRVSQESFQEAINLVRRRS